jgi:hypothetical protein
MPIAIDGAIAPIAIAPAAARAEIASASIFLLLY